MPGGADPAAVTLGALLRRALVLAIVVLALTGPVGRAADPILPLAEVRRGMQCTGLSVIRGTEVSSFDVEIIDVIGKETGLSGPRILVRVSGPAIADTGIGFGFSGSPIICDGRNAGAISEGVGEYGNDVALATPIEQILTARPPRPVAAQRAPRLARAARPLTGPLTVSGLSGRTRKLFTRAAARADLTVLAAPPGPIAGYAPVDLRPGSAAAAALATGDISIGGVGTVTYRDGENVWAFGHPLDNFGRRSLFLQDSYVYSVVSNPLGIPPFTSYKLATAGGHVVGSVTTDGSSSIAGIVGAEPPSVPLRVVGRNSAGRLLVLRSRLADERALGHGAGLGLVTPLAASQTIEGLMRSSGPVTFSMCFRLRVQELRRPMGFCNPYFSLTSALGHLSEAGDLVDSFDLAPLNIRDAELRLRARPGVKEDVLVDADAPPLVRPGQRIGVRLVVQRRRGGRQRISGSLRVPRSLDPGRHTIVLQGDSEDFSPEDAIAGQFVTIVIDFFSFGEEEREPGTAQALARRLRALHRPLGISARLRRRKLGLVVRSDEVSYGGSAKLRLRVARARPR
jgi:SpoIVB peptidase S55